LLQNVPGQNKIKVLVFFEGSLDDSFKQLTTFLSLRPRTKLIYFIALLFVEGKPTKRKQTSSTGSGTQHNSHTQAGKLGRGLMIGLPKWLWHILWWLSPIIYYEGGGGLLARCWRGVYRVSNISEGVGAVLAL